MTDGETGNTAPVSTTTTVKSLATTAARAERKVVRVQRRIWLAQLLLWPVLITTGLIGAALLVNRLRPAKPEPVNPPPDIQLP